jgi:hypothetical protein
MREEGKKKDYVDSTLSSLIPPEKGCSPRRLGTVEQGCDFLT